MKQPSFFGQLAQGIHFSNSTQSPPPLIDREIFFGDPEISAAHLSPDGKFISFLRPFEGNRNIWIKERNQSFEEAKPLTAETDRPISSYFWSRDGKYLLFVKDQNGDENFNIYALNPREGESSRLPKVRNITAKENIRAIIFHICRRDSDLIYIGLNDRDPSWHDLYSLRISTGKLDKIKENHNRFTNWIFDYRDQLRLAGRSREDGTGELWRLDADREFKLLEWSPLDSVYPVAFHKDNNSLYLVSNVGEDVDLSGLFLMDVENGEMVLVEKDPEEKVDFGSIFISDRSKEVVSTSYIDERTRRYFKKSEFEEKYRGLKEKLGDKEVALFSPTLDEKWWLVSAYGDTDPGTIYLYNWEEDQLTFQYLIRPEVPREHLSKMHHITYPSSDGLIIPAYLTIPKGFGDKNLPLLVMPHGGPWVRDYWGYNNYAQFFANRGYAVLSPNFRISTGYGKAFLNAGNQEWGDKMQDDLSWGVKYLVEKGIVDESRVGIFGGSYGGYATLAGLAFTPEIYACGVSFVGPSNLITLLNSIPPYWESARKMFHLRMGDPTTPEGKAKLERQSPLNSADKIKAPLMVVQGQNDPRVKKAESDQIVKALKKRGFPVVYLNAADEGHGFVRPINNRAFIAEMEKFLATHLGGRYQKEIPDEVRKRLDQIRVKEV